MLWTVDDRNSYINSVFILFTHRREGSNQTPAGSGGIRQEFSDRVFFGQVCFEPKSECLSLHPSSASCFPCILENIKKSIHNIDDNGFNQSLYGLTFGCISASARGSVRTASTSPTVKSSLPLVSSIAAAPATPSSRIHW